MYVSSCILQMKCLRSAVSLLWTLSVSWLSTNWPLVGDGLVVLLDALLPCFCLLYLLSEGCLVLFYQCVFTCCLSPVHITCCVHKLFVLALIEVLLEFFV